MSTDAASRTASNAAPSEEGLAAATARGIAVAWHAHHTPAKTAIICGDERWTYAELNAAANRLARALRARGCGAAAESGEGAAKRGETGAGGASTEENASEGAAALLCRNRGAFAVAVAATQRLGMRLTPINWHLKAEEAAYIVRDCEARVLIADADLAELASEVAAAAPEASVRIAAGGALDGFERLEAIIAGQSGADIDDPKPGRTMLYTSGTTGRPKGVLRRRPAASRAGSPRHNLPEGSVVLCTGPLYHAAPLSQNLMNPLNQGHTVLIMPRFDAEEALRLIDRHRVTHTHMVATMFHRMLALPPEVRARYDVSSIQRIYHGAAPTPVHVKRAMLEWFGPKIHEYYAATETGGTAITPEEWVEKPGSVGRPEPGQVVKVLDDDGRELPPGEIGTVYFDATASGGFDYYKDPEKTASVHHGSLYTLGDRGHFDADGYLYLTGRSSELILSGGVNIYPAEVDAVLTEHPAVADVATVGVPNEEFGEEVKAVVEPHPDAEPTPELAEALLAHCRERLASFKCPRSVDFTDALPRTDAGKLLRRDVRARYWPA